MILRKKEKKRLKNRYYILLMNSWLREEVTQDPCNEYGKYHTSFYHTKIEERRIENNILSKYSRHHTINQLFAKLVDYCINNNICNNDNTPVLNSGYKRHFIKFVYDTSRIKNN